jgi:hypothetical protein
VFPVGPHEHLQCAGRRPFVQAPLGFLRFSLSSDGASDKRRLKEPLILEVKLMSALGA